MNLTPLLEDLTIVPKDIASGIQPFRLNWAQQILNAKVHEQLRATGRVRIVTLKARQLGISTYTGGLAFNMCHLVRHYKAFVMAHTTKASKGLMTMSKNYWKYHKRFPGLYKTKYASQLHMEWEAMDSGLQVATAGSEDEGRSHTIHFLHGSEVAFWPDPYTLMGGLRQAIPESALSMIVLESTANGVGNYWHELCMDSMRGKNEFAFMFFPWHKHYEYRASYIGLPVPHPFIPQDEEEKLLQRIGFDADQLIWRRWAIANKCQQKVEMFHQEYPITPQEAFLSTGTNVFKQDQLIRHYFPTNNEERGRLMRVSGSNGVKFIHDPTGPLFIYKHPHPNKDWGKYIVGADGSRSMQGDPVCAQVLNRRTQEVVAVFDTHLQPYEFAEQLAMLGYYYNTAILVPEKGSGGGYTAIGGLIQANYPNIGKYKAQDRVQGIPDDLYGWLTTETTKTHTIARLQQMVIDPIHPALNVGLRIHNTETYKQMTNYITMPPGKRGTFGPADEASGGHDDHVMALGIACAADAMESPLPAYNLNDPTMHPPTPEMVWN